MLDHFIAAPPNRRQLAKIVKQTECLDSGHGFALRVRAEQGVQLLDDVAGAGVLQHEFLDQPLPVRRLAHAAEDAETPGNKNLADPPADAGG